MPRTKSALALKDEAVRQVIYGGQPVFDVAKRLTISEGVLYIRVSKFRKADAPVAADLKAMQAEVTKLKRSVLCQVVRVKYAFIQTHRREFRLASMCRVLRVHRSGYYAWLHEPLSPRAKVNVVLTPRIRESVPI